MRIQLLKSIAATVSGPTLKGSNDSSAGSAAGKRAKGTERGHRSNGDGDGDGDGDSETADAGAEAEAETVPVRGGGSTWDKTLRSQSQELEEAEGAEGTGRGGKSPYWRCTSQH